MSNAKEWRTARLIIRRFRIGDFDGLHELHSGPEATQFIGGVRTTEQTRERLDAVIRQYDESELTWLAVERRVDDAVIGVCWLGPLGPRWDAAVGEGHIELGYRYARRFWGQGYATEAARAMLDRGFAELKLPQIVAIVDARNAASERVLQKLGMTLRKTFEQEGMTINFYTIDRDEWLKRR